MLPTIGTLKIGVNTPIKRMAEPIRPITFLVFIFPEFIFRRDAGRADENYYTGIIKRRGVSFYLHLALLSENMTSPRGFIQT